MGERETYSSLHILILIPQCGLEEIQQLILSERFCGPTELGWRLIRHQVP
jgi:hypothetical protein